MSINKNTEKNNHDDDKKSINDLNNNNENDHKSIDNSDDNDYESV